MKRTGILAAALFLCIAGWSGSSFSDEVYLKNGDRLTGSIREENDAAVLFVTDSMGVVTIKRDRIDRVVAAGKEERPREETPQIIWKREVAAGYNTTRGNTKTEDISGSFSVSRNKVHVDEITVKGDAYYASADRQMNTQKWYGMGRYAFSFGKTKKWYNFYRIEGDHDRFANIDYRIIPAAGIGYWFFDLARIKFMLEAAAGLEYTDFADETKDSSEIVLIPRLFYEQKIFKNITVSEDLIFYPPVENFGDYRLRSETALTGVISKGLAVRLSLIDDYNRKPPEDTKKNDMRVLSSVVYSF